MIWSAVAACTLDRDVSVGDAVAAAAFGYELTVRLAEALGPEHRARWHVTTTAGTVGAAGAAALVFGGDDTAAADAVAHAVSVAGGSAHAMLERTATRFLHRAHAVESGLACARAACAGKRAGRGVLDEGRGAFVLADPGPLTARRSRTALEETGFRLHAATGFAHSALDAALVLDTPSGIEHVRVGVSPVAVALASNPSPRDAEEEWWSIEHAVASVLGVEIGRIEVQPTTEGWAATVEVHLRDGSAHTSSVNEPRGHPDRPASDDDLRTKWAQMTGTDGTEPFERVTSAEDVDSFAALVGSIH